MSHGFLYWVLTLSGSYSSLKNLGCRLRVFAGWNFSIPGQMLLSEGGMGCDPWVTDAHFRSSWKGFGAEVHRSFTSTEVLFATFMDSTEPKATT